MFFALSLILNLVLLLSLVFLCRTPAPNLAPATQFTTNTIQESRPTIRKDSKRVAAQAAPSSQWSQVEAADLAVYAANLRAAGCPEKTVRDILLPLIEEQFEHARHPGPAPTNFWASFSQRQAAEAARAEQEIALEQQKEKAIKELLGFAWTTQGLKQAYEGDSAFFLGFLDYDHAEKLFCIADRFEKKFSRAEHQKGSPLPIYHAVRQELALVLSPAEFEETELRAILFIFHLIGNPDIFKAGLSGSEVRQLMALRRDLCNPIQSVLLEGPLFDGHQSPCEQPFNTQARSLLGDSRFIDYLRSYDLSMERTLEALEKEHLPRSLAVQLFDIRQNVRNQALEIRGLTAPRAEKRAYLAALRQNAIAQIAALSDSSTNSLLIEINQDWLQETANP